MISQLLQEPSKKGLVGIMVSPVTSGEHPTILCPRPPGVLGTTLLSRRDGRRKATTFPGTAR